MGLNVKLDVGLYRLDQQVACQRYRQIYLDAKSRLSSVVATYRDVKSYVLSKLAMPVYAPALV